MNICTLSRLARRALPVIAWVATTILPATHAQAQIRIGQSAGFSGPVAAGVAETTAGAKLYFDAVNARGGVNGQRVELVSLDDRFDPAIAAKNARTLIDDPAVLALFLSRGTPQTEAMLPAVKAGRLALIAPSTGAMVLRKPVNPQVFNVRASYQREAQRAIEHLQGIGTSRIALFYPNDSFGADAVAGADQGFAFAHLKPVFAGQFDQQNPQLKPLVEAALKANAQAVVFIGSAQAVADGTAMLRQGGSSAQVLTLSNNASAGFVTQMGANARGTVVSQVFPSERSAAYPLIQEVQKLARAAHMASISPAVVEGFAGAKVVVEALKRAGTRPTRATVLAALDGLGTYDLGGMSFTYGPTNHAGLDFVDLAIINSSGKLQR